MSGNWIFSLLICEDLCRYFPAIEMASLGLFPAFLSQDTGSSETLDCRLGIELRVGVFRRSSRCQLVSCGRDSGDKFFSASRFYHLAKAGARGLFYA